MLFLNSLFQTDAVFRKQTTTMGTTNEPDKGESQVVHVDFSCDLSKVQVDILIHYFLLGSVQSVLKTSSKLYKACDG